MSGLKPLGDPDAVVCDGDVCVIRPETDTGLEDASVAGALPDLPTTLAG